MRVIGTEITAPTIDPKGLEDREIVQVRLKLMTPMIGGGTTAGQVDPHWPIRASSVRGHLRWWWRASRGALYETLEEMASAEAALFGGISETDDPDAESHGDGGGAHEHQSHGKEGKSKMKWGAVKIEIQDIKAAEPFKVVDDPKAKMRVVTKALEKYKIPGYALGPMNGSRPLSEITFLRECEFTVRLAENPTQTRLSDEQINEVKQALALWILLGGIGARTRRGFGALMPSDKDSQNFVNSFELNVLKQDQVSLKEITSVHGAKLLAKTWDDPFTAWAHAIHTYQCFRKAEFPHFKNPKADRIYSDRNQRTPWPEADMIRQIFNKNKKPLNPAHRTEGPYHFPRAVFGLPIQFNSQEKHAGYFGEVRLALKNENGTRFMSRVITKPVYYKGEYISLIGILQQQLFKENELILIKKNDSVGGNLDTGRVFDDLMFYHPDGNDKVDLSKGVIEAFARFAAQKAGYKG